jgi:hypothetical protein
MRSERSRKAAAAFKRERRRLRNIKGVAPVRDAAYLDFIRTLPCCVCRAGEISQYSITEAAHTGVRGLGQKASDTEAIPLCAEHHREGPYAHHRIGVRFFEFWGLSREALIAEYQERYQAEKWGRTIGEMDQAAEAGLR